MYKNKKTEKKKNKGKQTAVICFLMSYKHLSNKSLHKGAVQHIDPHYPHHINPNQEVCKKKKRRHVPSLLWPKSTGQSNTYRADIIRQD